MTATASAISTRRPDIATGLVELPIHDPRWLAFVQEQPSASPFHHPAWATLLADCYGFRALALAVLESERITAGLPIVEVSASKRSGRRWVSLPFTDYCAPLFSPTEEAVSALATARARSGVSQLEVRAPLEGKGVHSDIRGYRHTIKLERDSDAVFASFRKSRVQRGIRQGEKFIADRTLSIRRAETEEDLAAVFYGLHVATRRRQGVPVQPRRFFRLLWERMLEPGRGFTLLAYSGGTPVAGAVFLTWGKTMIYKFGASDPGATRLRPNHLLMWEAIREGCVGGFDLFDFGRTELDGESLRDYKLGWGADEETLVYSGLGAASRAADSRGAKALGAVIRRSPRWVCRATGELLYKRAA